ncbi:hypothetical protein FNP_pFN3g08 (plasmid) [Fusobacterium polymorphum ATCC 10953]|uniref:Uncharacterized protein n=1 Tax=Fusobacterium polymorphum ATCC 10953 TaxID=393480 RepID=A5VW52_FUSNP|nr:hypothetical protein FNP_pFN3g08 [Fusobacterium polymorphum ATCC 10953]
MKKMIKKWIFKRKGQNCPFFFFFMPHCFNTTRSKIVKCTSRYFLPKTVALDYFVSCVFLLVSSKKIKKTKKWRG